MNSGMFCFIPEIQANNKWYPSSNQLKGKPQVPLQIGRIHNVYKDITIFFGSILEHINGNLFGFRARFECVGAGHINHFCFLTFDPHISLRKFNSCSRVVRSYYMDACQSGENNTLPDIGIAY